MYNDTGNYLQEVKDNAYGYFGEMGNRISNTDYFSGDKHEESKEKDIEINYQDHSRVDTS